MTRGGYGSKVHLMTDAGGLPLAVILTQGNRNECPVFDELLERTLLDTGGVAPQRLAADRGYSSDKLRAKIAALGIEPVIPYRKTEHVTDRPPLNEQAYKGRNVIERCVGKLKEMRRIGTRYESSLPITWRCSRWAPSSCICVH
ncbi:MAG: IS5 family transposase [Burkholderiales bacterium]|nr:IS5 family transposase [Phycisphaerae bacterium]